MNERLVKLIDAAAGMHEEDWQALGEILRTIWQAKASLQGDDPETPRAEGPTPPPDQL